MSFPTVYREISEMILDDVLKTELARAIMRKSGFMPGGAFSAEEPAARQVLTVSPVTLGEVGFPVPVGTHFYPVVPSVWS